jgi:hypothetical protein
MARLRPGVSAAQAQAALAVPFFEWGRATNPTRRAEDIPKLVVRDGTRGLDSLRRTYSKPLYLLLTLAGLILAIACANIANLLLARAAARRREIAVRLSIGAGRARVIRQLLTESVVLALTGGALGVAFAVMGIRFLTLLLANGREHFTLRADLNWTVLAVTAGLSLLTGVLFGLAPSLQSTRLDLTASLKQSRTGEARGHGLLRLNLSRILMVSQIGITLLILVAAGLFVRTLSNLASMLALVGYPFALEPWIATRLQSYGWSGAYVLVVLLFIACGWYSLRAPAATTDTGMLEDATGALILLKIVDATIGLRVTEEDEMAGLDLSQHGETAYTL